MSNNNTQTVTTITMDACAICKQQRGLQMCSDCKLFVCEACSDDCGELGVMCFNAEDGGGCCDNYNKCDEAFTDGLCEDCSGKKKCQECNVFYEEYLVCKNPECDECGIKCDGCGAWNNKNDVESDGLCDDCIHFPPGHPIWAYLNLVKKNERKLRSLSDE